MWQLLLLIISSRMIKTINNKKNASLFGNKRSEQNILTKQKQSIQQLIKKIYSTPRQNGLNKYGNLTFIENTASSSARCEEKQNSNSQTRKWSNNLSSFSSDPQKSIFPGDCNQRTIFPIFNSECAQHDLNHPKNSNFFPRKYDLSAGISFEQTPRSSSLTNRSAGYFKTQAIEAENLMKLNKSMLMRTSYEKLLFEMQKKISLFKSREAAAKKIQKMYRGYTLRKNIVNILERNAAAHHNQGSIIAIDEQIKKVYAAQRISKFLRGVVLLKKEEQKHHVKKLFVNAIIKFQQLFRERRQRKNEKMLKIKNVLILENINKKLLKCVDSFMNFKIFVSKIYACYLGYKCRKIMKSVKIKEIKNELTEFTKLITQDDKKNNSIFYQNYIRRKNFFIDNVFQALSVKNWKETLPKKVFGKKPQIKVFDFPIKTLIKQNDGKPDLSTSKTFRKIESPKASLGYSIFSRSLLNKMILNDKKPYLNKVTNFTSRNRGAMTDRQSISHSREQHSRGRSIEKNVPSRYLNHLNIKVSTNQASPRLGSSRVASPGITKPKKSAKVINKCKTQKTRLQSPTIPKEKITCDVNCSTLQKKNSIGNFKQNFKIIPAINLTKNAKKNIQEQKREKEKNLRLVKKIEDLEKMNNFMKTTDKHLFDTKIKFLNKFNNSSLNVTCNLEAMYEMKYKDKLFNIQTGYNPSFVKDSQTKYLKKSSIFCTHYSTEKFQDILLKLIGSSANQLIIF